MSKDAEFTVCTSGAGASSEEAAATGVCSIVKDTEEEAFNAVRDLLLLLPSNNLSGAPVSELEGVVSAEVPAEASAFEVPELISDPGSFLELGKEFGKAARTGISQLSGATVGFVSYMGELEADSCSKAARFVRFCDAFSIPVVSFVDASEFTSLRDAVKLSNAYAEATAAKVTVITGSAYGPVYIALSGRGANADCTLAWDRAVVSPIAPAAAALFLHNEELKDSENPVADRAKLIEEYTSKEANPLSAAAQGYIEDVILPGETREKVIANLAMLSGKRVSNLPKKHSNIQL